MQRGRPKKNKLITSLKVRTWFHAVAMASGRSAYELEREFSPAYLADDEEYAKRRPRLWEKYRQGAIEPSSKPIKGSVKSIAERVEEVYPGTIYWLQSPLWTLSNFDYPITMAELKDIYHSLDPTISKHLAFEGSPDRNQVFWRNFENSKIDDISTIYHVGGIESVIALLGIIRESIICQEVDMYCEANSAVITLLEKRTDAPLEIVRNKLRSHVIKLFTSTWLPSGGNEFHKPFYDSKHRGIYDIRFKGSVDEQLA